MGDDYHLQRAPLPLVPGNEGIGMPQISTEAQAVSQAEPCWDPNDLEDNGGGVTLSA
jgi:hypothetical protein